MPKIRGSVDSDVLLGTAENGVELGSAGDDRLDGMMLDRRPAFSA